MIDLGLTTGIKDLWKENLLHDYTLIVQGREFKVHKVVLAGVSHYFKVLLSDGFKESKMDRIEVKEFSADIVGKLLEFIYTGEESSVEGDELDILRCAMYLQIPLISQYCVKKLMENLNVDNCLEILSALIEFSFRKEVKEVKHFIQRKWRIVENCDLETLMLDTVEALLDCWQTCEWKKFLFVKNWIYNDYGRRIGSVNELMSRVRFCLIGPNDLQSIMKMEMYDRTDVPWQDLVVKALTYHQLPINLKVIYKSEQSAVKTEPQPAFFCVMARQGEVLLFGANRKYKWKQYEQKGFTPPNLGDYPYSVGLEVNNFLVVCITRKEVGQEWYIFDPRTMSWCTMTNMDNPKGAFAMVHHNDHLNVVGGKYLTPTPAAFTEQYSFQTNTWSSIDAMPVSVQHPAACVLGDTLYVSGGELEGEVNEGSDGFYSINLSSGNHTWQRKASCLMKCYCHEMNVLKRGGEEAIFIIDDLDFQFYSPSADQWSRLVNKFKPDDFEPGMSLDKGTVVVSGNCVYILNMYTVDEDASWDGGHWEDEPWKHVSWKLVIPEDGQGLVRTVMQDLPETLDKDRPCYPDVFGAMLAIPPQKD